MSNGIDQHNLHIDSRRQTAVQEPFSPKIPALQNKVLADLYFSPKYNSGSNTQRTTMMKSNSALEVIKVSSTYEYYYYLKHKQEYQKKQQELIVPLQIDGYPSEHISRITYSIKQVGVSDTNDGKFGIQSQRKYIQSCDQKTKVNHLANSTLEPLQQTQNDRIYYKFNSRRLKIGASLQKEKKISTEIMSNCPTFAYDITRGSKTIHYQNVKSIKRLNNYHISNEKPLESKIDVSYVKPKSSLSRRGTLQNKLLRQNLPMLN